MFRRSRTIVKLKRAEVFARVYFFGKHGQVKWSEIHGVPAGFDDTSLGGPPPPLEECKKAFHQYALALACPQDVLMIDNEDSPDVRYFQVFRAITTDTKTPWTTRRRSRGTKCEFLVQEYEPLEDRVDGNMVLAPSGFTRRVPAHSLGEARDWLRRTQRLTVTVEEAHGHLRVTDTTLALPACGLFSAATPVLYLGQELLNRGWTPSGRMVKHDATTAKHIRTISS